MFRGEGHYYYEGSGLSAGPVKRLVLEPLNERTALLHAGPESPNHHQEFGGSLGGPIVRDRLFFYGSYSPRNEQTDQHLQLHRRHRRHSARHLEAAGVRQADVREPRVTANWSTLWTPTKAEGSHFGYTGCGPNVNSRTAARVCELNRTRGYEINQVNTSGAADINLSNSSFLSARGGYFHDRYSDTGIPLIDQLPYGNPTTPVNDHSAGLAAGADGLGQHAARADHGVRHDQAVDLQPGLQPRVQRLAASTRSRAATASSARRTTSTRSIRAATSTSSGTARSRSAARPGAAPTGTTRSTTGGSPTRPATTSTRSTSRTSGRVGSRLTLNLGLRTENEKRADLPSRVPEERDRVRFRRQDGAPPRRGVRRVWRRPDEGVRQLGAATTTGRGTSCRAVRSAPKRGASTTVASRRSTSTASA